MEAAARFLCVDGDSAARHVDAPGGDAARVLAHGDLCH